MAKTLFESGFRENSRSAAVAKSAILVLLAVFLIIAMVSGYRAYFQVRSLDLRTSEPILRSGSTIRTTVVSYGRTFVAVRLELIQGTHSEVLAVQHVPKNEWALFDPRTQRATQTVVLTPELLARFQAGPAQLRATARGRPQWMRVPPPILRELAVEIQHEPVKRSP